MNKLKSYFCLGLISLLCGLSNIGKAQVAEIKSDCISASGMEIIGLDGTGRNLYSNGAVDIAWSISGSRWQITYSGSVYWISNIASSPDPSFSVGDWTKVVSACNSLVEISKYEIEVCSGGGDEDLDGFIDCLDSDCALTNYFIKSSSSASFVTGQTNFNSNTGGLTSDKMDGPSDIAIDPTTNKVFVADTDNHRILRYENIESFLNNSPAESVLGQTDFISNAQLSGPNRTQRPRGIHVDQNGILWVACYNGSRVLRFENASNLSIGANADGVLGQSDFNTGTNGGGANGMYNPTEVFVDENNTLWVSDYSNRRLLRFDNASAKANGANADGVLGQPDFTTYGGSINQGVTGSTWGIVKIDNSLFVSDYSGHRIMRWDSPELKANGADADMVIGQPNFDNTSSGIDPAKFNRPASLDKDGDGRLYLCDNQNSRILVFEDAVNVQYLQPADRVLGQINFTSNTVGTQDHELNRPKGVTILNDGVSNLVAVSDYSNHRLISWGYSNITDELTNYTSHFNGFDPNGNALAFTLGSSPTFGSVSINNASTGEFTYIAPGPAPLMEDSDIGLLYTVTNSFCSHSDTLNLRVKDKINNANSSYVVNCSEELSVNWYDGSSGIQWPISSGASSVTANHSISGLSGNVSFDLTLDNSSGHNIDFGNCGTDGNHFYTATCNDPNEANDCDGDPGTTDGQITMGCGSLSMGMTSNTSADEVKFILDFDVPVRITDLIIMDIDYEGSTTPTSGSWQDEVEIRAFNGASSVNIAVEVGANVSVSNNFSPIVNVAANYDPNSYGGLSPTDPTGHAQITSMDYVTSLEIILSNGPDDDGISDDHVIGISSFNVCPQFQENLSSLCSDGIDNDMDGLTDCLDYDCNGISSCSDNDSDGVSDLLDEDDDNDGISDQVESNRKILNESVAWTHDNPLGGFNADTFSNNGIYDWLTTSISTEQSNNLTFSSISGYSTIEGISQSSLSGAIANDEYLEYEFTIANNILHPHINWISAGVSSFLIGDSYYVSCIISDDNFSSYTILASDVQIKINPSSYETFPLNVYGIFPLMHNTQYQIRIYPYGQIDDSSAALSVWDDFTLFVQGFEIQDNDMDSKFNHLDLDSDNDGIYDVIEAGGIDSDNDGIIGTGTISDPNFNGWSNICDPYDSGTELPDNDSDTDLLPNRLELDSDADGCNDVKEAGFPDSNNDGILGGLPITVNSNGKVIYTP